MVGGGHDDEDAGRNEDEDDNEDEQVSDNQNEGDNEDEGKNEDRDEDEREVIMRMVGTDKQTETESAWCFLVITLYF